MDTETIQRTANRFYIGESPEHALAEVTFFPTEDGRFIIDRTYVDESLRGQGVGRRLIDAVVALARSENRRISPQCSYARAIMARCETCRELMAPDPADDAEPYG